MIEKNHLHADIRPACRCCPRECGPGRTSDRSGYCRSGGGLEIASICRHRGEEPAFGGKGVVNVFFFHCNLQCVYCQNFQISRNTVPVEIQEPEKVLRSITGILDTGVDCVGFVSPSHMIEQMKMVIVALHGAGRRPVIVMNTNAYDKPETIASLAGLVDVYLPDFKYSDRNLALAYSAAADYPETALRALREMYRQKGADLVYDDAGGRVKSGLIVRHLILPGHIENSRECLRLLSEELSPSVHVSLMSQYYPTPAVKDHPRLGRSVTRKEYDEVLAEFHRLGFYRGWVQELDSPAAHRPNFTRKNPFAGAD